MYISIVEKLQNFSNITIGGGTRAESLALRGFPFHMRYFLYLKRSLTRAWRSHLLLMLLLACALALPLCLSIMESSTQYGIQQYNAFHTGGHSLRIRNAKRGDETIFDCIPGTFTVWEDGKLYLDRTPDNPLQYDEDGIMREDLTKRITEMPEWSLLQTEGFSLELLDGYHMNPAFFRVEPKIRCVVLAFSLLLQGIVLVYFGCKQQKEWHQLSMIGASRIQLRLLQFVQYVFHTLLSTALSIAMTYGFMRFLIANSMHLPSTHLDKQYRVGFWILFHVNRKEIAEIALLCLAFGMFACLWSPSVSRKGQWFRWKYMLPVRMNHRIHSVVSQIFLRKDLSKVGVSFLLAVPMLIAAILLLSLRTPTEVYQRTAEYPISISLNSTERTWLDTDFESLHTIDGVAGICMEYNPQLYYVIDNRVQEPIDRAEENWRYSFIPGFTVGLLADETMTDDIFLPETDANGDTIYHAAMDCTRTIQFRRDEEGEYTIREEITYEKDELREIRTQWGHSFQIQFSEILEEDTAWQKRNQFYADNRENPFFAGGPETGDLILYLRPEDYEQISSIKPITKINVKIRHVSDSFAVQKALYDVLGEDAIAVITNEAAMKETMYNRAVGMNLLYTTLSVLLFAFFAVITTLSLIDYAVSHADTLRLLHMQGASHRAIIAAFVEIMLPPGILTCAAVWAIVTPVEREYYRLRGYTDAYMPQLGIRLDDPLYLAAALAVMAVFVAPVICTVVRQLRRLDRG